MALASLHFSRGLQAAVALTSDLQVSVTYYSTKPHLDCSDYIYLHLRVFKGTDPVSCVAAKANRSNMDYES